MSDFILNIPKPTSLKTFGDYLCYPIEDIDKTFTTVIGEIPVDETGQNGLTTAERQVLLGFVQTLCSQPNPDFDEAAYEADPENYDVDRYIPYDPTIREFAEELMNTLGTLYQLVGDETKQFRVVALPPLEDSLVIVPGIGERDLIKLFGRGKDKPNYTLFRAINSNERKGLIEPVPMEI